MSILLVHLINTIPKMLDVPNEIYSLITLFERCDIDELRPTVSPSCDTTKSWQVHVNNIVILVLGNTVDKVVVCFSRLMR